MDAENGVNYRTLGRVSVLLKSDRWEGVAALCLALGLPVITLVPIRLKFSVATVLFTFLWICFAALTPMFCLSAVRRANRLNRTLGWVAFVIYGLAIFVLFTPPIR